ncbi:hypothetical protein N7539_001066 [Penicillium diatomitis]|uniref:Sensor histidine kinase/response regulator n=1 Tax=Penicillium diatomitis TaxID=2819901 RepID=A0A9W9XP05_9EURO|nr:uncharacterized protein N7539_001066 [Penicillium diatomitis]KAJ5495950.1 hypothetical protein N7539_001066 [Penicillium diatomitis]
MNDSVEDIKNSGWRVFFRRLGHDRKQSSASKTDGLKITEVALDDLKADLPHLSSDTKERVFPVRSLISVNSASSSALPTPSLDQLEKNVSPFSDVFKRSTLVNDGSRKPDDEYGRTDSRATRPAHLEQMHEQKQRLAGISPSSKVPTIHHPASPGCRLQPSSNSIQGSAGSTSQKGGPYERLCKSIKDGAHILRPTSLSKGLQFSTQDEDAIVIQSFGALIVVSQTNGDFVVEAASSNTGEVLSAQPDDLFKMKSFSDILTPSYGETFRQYAEYVLSDEYTIEQDGPQVFYLLTLNASHKRLWCTMHTSKAYKNYIICELELDQQLHKKDFKSLSRQRPTSLNQNCRDAASHQTLSYKVSDDSSQKADSARWELLNEMPHVAKRITSAQSMNDLVERTVEILKDLLQFHRITMYCFDPERGGVVLVDAVEEAKNLESYQGMHFPESSFSDHLKCQYLRDRVALSYRKGKDIAELVYRVSINKMAMDLSHCYLTASPDEPDDDFEKDSPFACLSIGLEVFGRCWGLISCQSFDEHFRLHPLLQRLSWLVGDMVSSSIERLSYTFPFQIRGDSVADNTLNDTLEQHTINSGGDLLGLFGANHAAAFLLEKTKLLGKPSDSQEMMAILEYFRRQKLDCIVTSAKFTDDFPELNYPSGFHDLTSLLYIPLSRDGTDFIVFLKARPKGDVSDKAETESLEWSPADYGKASMLALLYRAFKGTWHENDTATQNNQLMKLLLANTAHEFRTPLNAVINYLEIALSSPLDQETRESLSRSHSASKSLIFIINDLLDLTNAENGNELIKDEVFSFSETIFEATNIFWEEAKQKNVTLQLIEHSDLPPVLGDQRRVRQVVTNLISNAVRHTSSGAVTVESCIAPVLCEVGQIPLEVAVHDTGEGMSQETVESLFCELEQVVAKAPTAGSSTYSNGLCSLSNTDTDSVLGLGLALVARLVSNMNGQLSLKSEEGTGSCFRLRLRFPLSPEAESSSFKSKPCSCGGIIPYQQSGNEVLSQGSTPRNQEDSTLCRCGDNDTFGSEVGKTEDSSLDIEISLTNGDSRSISLPAPLLKSEKNLKPVEVLYTASPQEKKEKSRAPIKQPKAPTSGSGTSFIDRDIASKLRVLVAEDDPVNSHIMKRRLEKLGYDVHLTANGKECAAIYGQNPGSYDAILMDLQMPVVDGLSAAKLIRDQEGQATLACDRVPIFAISASLVEKDRPIYMEAGFNGLIMKPIDFGKVNTLLEGVQSKEQREQCQYQPGFWE